MEPYCTAPYRAAVSFKCGKRAVIPGGFTIVELLLVIVIIAILASIVLVSYQGIASQALGARLQTDVSNAAQQLANDRTTTGSYPATIAAANGGKGLPKSDGTIYQYSVNTAGTIFCLTGTNLTYGSSYKVDNTNLSPTSGVCLGQYPNPVANNSNITAASPTGGSVNMAYSSYVNISSTANGTPTPTVQWQRLPKNVTTGTWTDIPGQTSPNLNWAFGSLYTDGDTGYFQAVYTNSSGTISTHPTLVTFYYDGD